MAQTILIVDDDPAQRRLLESVISAQGYRALTAADGKQALETLRGPKAAGIDLVLLDLVMPGISGINVLEEIRPGMPGLPVVVLTANGSVATVVQAMQAGANDFIVKPASPERLQVSIQNALKMNVLTGEISRLSRKSDHRLLFTDLIG